MLFFGVIATYFVVVDLDIVVVRKKENKCVTWLHVHFRCLILGKKEISREELENIAIVTRAVHA